MDAQTTPAFSALTVLVVEDHEFQRRVARNMLQQLEVTHVLEAVNGTDGLAALRGHGAGVDVVLCDLQMPGMDGIEFIRRVAEERLSPSIIVVSGLDTALLSSVETMARGYGIKMLGAIEKPVTAQKLSNLLSRHRHGQTPAAAPELRFGQAEALEAVSRGEFIPYFQPKVSFADQRVLGVEALARWHHPRHGVLAPASFLKTVETTAVQTPFTHYILGQALQHFAHWQKGGAEFSLAVNLSLTFLEGERVAENIMAQVRDAGVAADNIVLEITESLATTQYGRVLENLARLRMNGFGISIDDYGTGYSSVQQLSRIPFTELKLDQSFVSGAASKPALRAILESALQLASKLKLNTVAEGIEREEEWLLLRSLGCHTAQGYYVSRPLPPEMLSDWVRDWTGSLEGH